MLVLSEPSTDKSATRDEVLKRMLKTPPKQHEFSKKVLAKKDVSKEINKDSPKSKERRP
jgi:hypothetical protein